MSSHSLIPPRAEFWRIMFYVVKDTKEIFQERDHIYNHGLQARYDLALHSNYPSFPLLLEHIKLLPAFLPQGLCMCYSFYLESFLSSFHPLTLLIF